MEWNKIVEEAEFAEAQVVKNLTVGSPLKDFIAAKVQIKEDQVKKAEMTDLIKMFSALNTNFEDRVKDENREQDVKNRNEKRAQKSPREKLSEEAWSGWFSGKQELN